MAMPAQRPGKSRQDYQTPEVFLTAVKRLLRISAFTMDFAADVHNTKAPKFWTIQDDSLAQSDERWQQRVGSGWGWLNPPYANISDWAAKALGSGAQIAFLVPASVGANWHRDFVDGQARVLFLNGRLSFDGVAPFPKDLMLVLFGLPASYAVWNWRVY